MKFPARQRIDNQRLNQALLYKVLRNAFPKKNDFYHSDAGYTEELDELNHFGISTVKELKLLLKKHRRKILEIDRSPMDKYYQKMYREEIGAIVFKDFIRRQYWFAYPALLRLALELEFGEKYETYADARDGIYAQAGLRNAHSPLAPR
jgi:hypothetical protein